MQTTSGGDRSHDFSLPPFIILHLYPVGLEPLSHGVALPHPHPPSPIFISNTLVPSPSHTPPSIHLKPSPPWTSISSKHYLIQFTSQYLYIVLRHQPLAFILPQIYGTIQNGSSTRRKRHTICTPGFRPEGVLDGRCGRMCDARFLEVQTVNCRRDAQRTQC